MDNQVYHCERCHTTPEKKGFDGEFDRESVAVIRLSEVQTNFGVLAVMCIDCRRDWMRWLNTNKTMREYSENGFRLEHWRMAHRKTGKEDVETGLAFVKKLNDLDEDLFNEAWGWIKAGPTKDDKAKRLSIPQSPRTSDDRDQHDDDDYE